MILQLLALATTLLTPPPPLVFKGPIVQQVTTTSAKLLWEATDKGPFKVIIGSEAGRRDIPIEATGPFPAMVSVPIEGLKPGSTYTWGLLGGTPERPIKQGTVTTQGPSNRPFTFMVYGDNRSDHRAHTGVVEAMAKEKADFWINTGDLVAVGARPRDWQIFFAIEGRHLASTPMWPVIGNHEVVGQGHRLFQRYFDLPGNELYYAMTWGNVRFVFIDTYVHVDQGAPNAAQQAFLLEEVEKAKADPKIDHIIGVAHAGPYSSNPHRHGNPPLRPLLKKLKAAGMKALLAGHDHFYERGTTDDGLPYLVVGCGGAPLYPTVGPGKHDGYTAHASRSTYGYVRMHSAGPVLKGCAVDLDGTAFDCFSISGAPAP
ncbi:MAG: metallophosphoesterase family protein [Bradymonadia bacterium]